MRKIQKRIVAIMMVLLTLFVNIPISTEKVEAAESWYWPVLATTSTSREYSKGVHEAEDISVPCGTEIYASKSGTAIKVINDCSHIEVAAGVCVHGAYTNGGNIVIIKHNDGTFSLYAHMTKGSIVVKEGQKVKQGEFLGLSGNSGNATGPHIHFQMRNSDNSNYWDASTINNKKSVINYVYSYTPVYSYTSSIVQNSNKFTNTKVEYVTDTTAKICTDVSQATYPECGFYFGTSGELSSMKKVSEGPTVTNAKYNSYRLGEIYTDTNSYKWWNPLTPGTKYYYAFYVTSGNTTYVSTIQSFTTTCNSNVDKIAPVISDVSVKADVAGYTITCTVTDNVGVTKVTFPSWTDEGGTDDIITPWPEGANTGSIYTYRVNDSDHNYARGKYSTDIHAYDAAGNESIYHIRSVDVNNTYKYATGVKCGNSMYYLYDDVLSWDEAKAKCESMGGHLAVVTSEDEQNAISFLFESGSVHRSAYYLGGTVNNSTISWVTGERASYTNWITGEPNNANGNENRLGIYKSNGSWNDCVESIHDSGFICEVEYPIILNVSNLKLNVSEQKNIQLTNTESDLDVTDVSWSSSDSSVATVSDTGLIRALKPGRTTITVKYGSEVATCEVIVIAHLKGISLNKTSETLNEGAASTLTVSYNPSNTTDSKTVIWTSSNTSVATVSSSGVVTAVKAGTATITATNRATGYTATCKVIVNRADLPSNKLTAPTGLQWDTEHFGTITWNPVEGAVSYIANLYCDGKQMIQCTIKTCENDFSLHMLNDGEYVAELYAVSEDSSKIASSDIVRSGSLEYKAPQQKVSVPANIYWQGTVLNWDAVKDASSYEIACFVNGQRKVWSYYVRTSYDVKRYLDQFGNDACIFKIRALSGDITKYGHSEYATAPEYDMSGTPEHPDEGQEEQVRNFVKRLYQVILNREAEEDGLNAWTKQLLAGKATGAQLVAGFVESDEFTQRGLSNEEVVEIMYQAMLGRTSDEGGKAGWSKILNNGCSYLNIVNGFSGSVEFNEICGNYGITTGTVELNRQRDKNPQLTAFVARCYTQALDRQYETNGLESWCDAIISGRNTPKQAAQNFIFSDEFTQKNLSTKEYVEVLYRTFMGREADEAGLAAWIEVLESGREDRAKVLEGFSDSVEFDGILQSFGLSR